MSNPNARPSFVLLFIAGLSLLFGACSSPQPAEPAEPAAPLRVMSFNIRYGTANDGLNSWPLRRELVLEVIGNSAPHILGVQEALGFQLDEIEERFEHYGRVGVGRDDGVAAVEISAILFDQKRLKLIDGGTFWLSSTPEVVASTSWGNGITRICTWAKFANKADGTRFHVFNTHWDHRSQPSRVGSAGLILERIAQIASDGPALLMGDFNAGEENPAFVQLVSNPDVPLRDSFRVLHPEATGVGTFNGFQGKTDGAKIDSVLVSDHWTLHRGVINREGAGERWPSDHFPVEAELSL
jgi:endonuclease/exonuclease/phosphatase family metal-dependent hydrolase